MDEALKVELNVVIGVWVAKSLQYKDITRMGDSHASARNFERGF